jgi:ADP-glucose pyrophosphorylase
VDKNCRIGAGCEVVNHDQKIDSDIGEICVIRDGILVVEKDASLPDGWRA